MATTKHRESGDITAPASDFPPPWDNDKRFVCQGCGTWTAFQDGGGDCPEGECFHCDAASEPNAIEVATSSVKPEPPCSLLCSECWCERHPN